MAKVTKSTANNIEVLSANGLSSFVDDTDGLLKLKDVNGVVEPITNYTGNCNGEVIVQGTGTCSALRCGVNNTASGAFSSSLGGQNNCALGAFSVVVGGCANSINSKDSFISHGNGNRIECNTNSCSSYDCGGFILGGSYNNITASSQYITDFIIAGCYNCIDLPIANGAGGNSIINSQNACIDVLNCSANITNICSRGKNNITNATGSCIMNCIGTTASICGSLYDVGGLNSITNSTSSYILTRDFTCFTDSGIASTFNKISESGGGRISMIVCGGGDVEPILPYQVYSTLNDISNSANSQISIFNNASGLTYSGYFNTVSSYNQIIGGQNSIIYFNGTSSSLYFQCNTIGLSSTLSYIYGRQPCLTNPQQVNIDGNKIIGTRRSCIFGCSTGGVDSTIFINVSQNDIFGGFWNCISATTDGCTEGGGATYNLLLGGFCNCINNSVYNTIMAGCCNKIAKSSEFSNILSGRNNCINCASSSFIGNGCTNRICLSGATMRDGFIGTGFANCVSGNCFSSVLNGCQNRATAIYSSVVGGGANISCGCFTFIGTGATNRASAPHSAVLSGQCNVASGPFSSIQGGFRNCTTGSQNFIGGGQCHFTSSTRSAIMGGDTNTASGDPSFIGGGFLNVASAPYTFIGGGGRNLASCNNAFIGAGFCNCSTGCISLIAGGCCNSASGYFSAVIGGGQNQATGVYSLVGNGLTNCATACYASVFGGQSNVASCVYSGIFGCGITSRMACAFHANRYVATNLPSASAGLPSGALWYDPADGNRVKYVP